LSGDATFLQRLLVGWTKSNGVKLVRGTDKRLRLSRRRPRIRCAITITSNGLLGEKHQEGLALFRSLKIIRY
jgi:hypothetical protein